MKQYFLPVVCGLMMSFPAVGREASTVSTATVESYQGAPVSWFNGSVLSEQSARISAEVSGRIIWMAGFGDSLDKGDLLAKIDDRPLKLEAQSRQLELSKAKQRYHYLKNELARLEALHQKKGLSRTELDQARHEYEQARLDVDFAKVNHARIQDRLNRAQVTAPFSGVVNERMIQPGEYVSEGDTLLQLVNNQAVEIRARVPIELFDHLSGDTPLETRFGERQQLSKIVHRGASADARSRLIEIRMKPQGEHWLPGTPVKVAIPLSEPVLAQRVPRDSVVQREEGDRVFKVMNTESRDELWVQAIPVEVLFGDNERVSVQGDLVAGDQVVVRGANRLQDNDAISVIDKAPLKTRSHWKCSSFNC